MKVPKDIYRDIYYNNLSDSSFKGTLITCDLEHDLNSYIGEISLPKRFIPTPITKSSNAFGFISPNLWNERLQEVIDGLISGGVIDHWLEEFRKSKWVLMSQTIKNLQIVLNLSHLGFGFQIWFMAIYAALVVFLMEFLVFWIKKPVKRKRKRRKKIDKFVTQLVVEDAQDDDKSLKSGCNEVNLIDLETVFGEKISNEVIEVIETVNSIVQHVDQDIYEESQQQVRKKGCVKYSMI